MTDLAPRHAWKGAPLCPKCHSDQTKVIDVRQIKSGGWRRRRKCKSCQHRWTSYSDMFAKENRIDLLAASERLIKRLRSLEEEVVDMVDVLKRTTNTY